MLLESEDEIFFFFSAQGGSALGGELFDNRRKIFRLVGRNCFFRAERHLGYVAAGAAKSIEGSRRVASEINFAHASRVRGSKNRAHVMGAADVVEYQRAFHAPMILQMYIKGE